MTTEAQAESPVPESAYADYEQDLLNDDVPPAQARATRRALERLVDRLMLTLATKAEMAAQGERLEGRLDRQQEQITLLLQDTATLKAEMRMLKWMFAVGGSAIMGLMTAVLVVLLTRL